jgi:hypothetical protein
MLPAHPMGTPALRPELVPIQIAEAPLIEEMGSKAGPNSGAQEGS